MKSHKDKAISWDCRGGLAKMLTAHCFLFVLEGKHNQQIANKTQNREPVLF